MSRKKVLLTGGTGFVGRNVLPILRERFEVDAPRRVELDLSDAGSVERYLARCDADYLVHTAICTPNNAADAGKNVLNDVLASFMQLARHPFEKIVFIGSGAEYDKSRGIVNVTEDDLGKVVPLDDYGLAKYTLTQIARRSDNIYNARIFGCYGPTEPERRFIRHAITCCLNHEPITIRRDCRFSYVHVADLGRALCCLLEETPRYHDYNIVGEGPFLLSEIAREVRQQMNVDVPLTILSGGLANEYSASGGRFLVEYPSVGYMTLKCGIANEIKWMEGCDGQFHEKA